MIRFIFWLALSCAGSLTFAAPGAHGPDGEHLDAPSGAQAGGANVTPRLETFTETFELTARLYGDELSILLDRFDTNEPVLNAQVEVELNGIKAAGQFHADHGDYSITDERLLKILATPGKHALLFTILAGDDNDLMEATLEVAAHDAHAHEHASPWLWVMAIGLMLVVIVVGLWLRRRSTNKGNA